jgi:hypothetical protein
MTGHEEKTVARCQESMVVLVGLAAALAFVSCRPDLRVHSQNPLLGHAAGVNFAVADLDGDRLPDLAVVELQIPRSASNNYRIRLQFSAGSESVIPVSAPLGGLRVSARDVNGDDNLDLVVSTDLGGRVIEVLINDGHGNFALAEPESYTEVQNEGAASLRGPTQCPAELFSLAKSRSLFDGESIDRYTYAGTLPTAAMTLYETHFVPVALASTRPGRAPPLPDSSA